MAIREWLYTQRIRVVLRLSIAAFRFLYRIGLADADTIERALLKIAAGSESVITAHDVPVIMFGITAKEPRRRR